ncbi:uncharacterized protein LOC143233152 [Tachypleus tridentatus]|uniref:uncharacterized protein LOC143233152 n=1 Tax=Tachypleus tridentatus TaxID=6853 RepID=UPI003FD50A23
MKNLVLLLTAFMGCYYAASGLRNDVKDINCPKEDGYYATSECHTYYDCKNGIGTRKISPSGLHFSRMTRMRDWPAFAGCEKGSKQIVRVLDYQLGEPTNNIQCSNNTCHCMYRDKNDCSIYCRCSAGIAYKQWCGDGLYFDPTRAICDLKTNVVCDISTTTTNPTSQPPIIGPFDCPEPYALFRDPHNCKRFYHCSHGIPYRKWCPADLHFNERLKVCDWPENACCEKNKPCPETTPEPIQLDKECDCECCFFPDAKNCAAYTYCEKRVLYKRRCSDGLYFNFEIANCDYKSNVQCELDPKCPQPNGKFPISGTSIYYLLCINNIGRREKCPEGLKFDPVTMCCTWPDTCNKTVTGLKPYLPKNECPCDCCAIPDPKDCTKFILCINGNAIMQTCADGLRFNPKIENCDYARNVDCDPPCDKDCDDKPTHSPGILCKKPSGLFPHPDKCNLFIHCSNGIPHVKNCPSILHFSPNLKVCDWPWNAGCGKPSDKEPPSEGECDCDCCMKPVPGDCAAHIRCENYQKYHGRCTDGLLFNPKTSNCDFAENVDCDDKPNPGSKCDSKSGLFPHPNDCTRFIHCANWNPYLKNCPSGLHFNKMLKICDWPETACCNVPTSRLPFPSLEPCTTPEPPKDGTCDLCECCLIPDKLDCAAFTRCENGKAYRERCSSGLFFNPKIENCDKEENVECEKPGVCPEPSGHFPHKDCTKFIQCDHGVPHIKVCSGGLHFNPTLKVCDWPDKVGCGEPSKPITPDPQPWPDCTICECCLIPDKNDCTKFYRCEFGKSFHGQCSTGLVFDPIQENCVYANDGDCGRETKYICPQPNGMFENKEDCGSFWHCHNGYGYWKKCPSSLHWSQAMQRCDWPCVARCDPSIAGCIKPTPIPTTKPGDCDCDGCFTPHPIDCASYYRCIDGIRVKYTCSPGLYFNRYTKKCDYENNVSCYNFKCPSRNGMFKNKNNCGMFWHCFDYIPYLKDCLANLHWSVERQKCKWPCIAKCDPSVPTCPTESTSVQASPNPCGCTSCVTPHPTDCSAYYRCKDGIRELVYCSPGLFFNKITKVCDHPKNVDCNHFMCPGNDGLFKNKFDCGSFWHCSHGIPYLKDCPYGLHWDEERQMCNVPCLAKCDPSIPNCEPTTTLKPVDPWCLCSTCVSEDPFDCRAYFKCSNGVREKKFCSTGLFFNRNTKVCDHLENVDCPDIGDPSICEKANGRFNFPGDCNKYVECINGIAYIKKCPSGQTFDKSREICVPGDDGCGNYAKNDCTKFYHCSNGIAYLKDCPASLYFNPLLKVCDWPKNVISCGVDPVPDPDPTCIVNPEIKCPSCVCRVADPHDCTTFYQCTIEGKACKKTCPTGLKFNLIKMVCDLPDNCDCTLALPTKQVVTIYKLVSRISIRHGMTSILNASGRCHKCPFGAKMPGGKEFIIFQRRIIIGYRIGDVSNAGHFCQST